MDSFWACGRHGHVQIGAALILVMEKVEPDPRGHDKDLALRWKGFSTLVWTGIESTQAHFNNFSLTLLKSTSCFRGKESL